MNNKNINWYGGYKKGMALPFVTNPNKVPDISRPENKFEDPYVGLRRVDKALTPEHAKELSVYRDPKNPNSLKSDAKPNMEYIDSGYWGSVYSINSSQVRKFTNDYEEVEVCKRIMEIQEESGGKKLPFATYIYSIRDLTKDIYKYKGMELPKDDSELPFDSHNSLYEIIAEKVIPANSFDRYIFNRIFDKLFYHGESYVNNNEELDYNNLLNDDFDSSGFDSYEESEEEKLEREHSNKLFVKLCDATYKLVQSMHNYGITNADMHPKNVGWRDDGGDLSLVILDLGAIRIPS